MKKIVLLAFVLVLLLPAVVVGFISTVASYPAETELLMEVDLPVHNIDSGKNFSTIQEAINDNETLDGHKILVDSGTYYENVVVNKTLSLIGENMENTIIDARLNGTVVRVVANNVTIENFTITNSGEWSSAGIYLGRCNNTRIKNNNITNNICGIYLDGSFYSIITGNSINNNRGYGINLAYSFNNTVSENSLVNNPWDGVSVYYSSHNTMTANTLASNHIGVYLISNSFYNKICHNNFIDNDVQAHDNCYPTNVWDEGYPSGGNYWSDYNGTDLFSGPYQNETGSDGIGDSPYFIDSAYTTNVTRDNYPLMNPYIPPEEIRVLYYELLRKYKELLADFDNLTSAYCELSNEYGELLANYNALNITYYELLASYNNLQAHHNLLNSSYNSLNASYNELQSKQEATVNELNNIRNLMYVFIATTIVFIATTVYLATRKTKVKPELKTT